MYQPLYYLADEPHVTYPTFAQAAFARRPHSDIRVVHIAGQSVSWTVDSIDDLVGELLRASVRNPSFTISSKDGVLVQDAVVGVAVDWVMRNAGYLCFRDIYACENPTGCTYHLEGCANDGTDESMEYGVVIVVKNN